MDVSFQRVNVEQLDVTFINDLNSGISELKVFGEIIKKCYKEANRAGYKKMFNAEEKEMIDDLYDRFVADYTQNVNVLGSGLTYVQDDE